MWRLLLLFLSDELRLKPIKLCNIPTPSVPVTAVKVSVGQYGPVVPSVSMGTRDSTYRDTRDTLRDEVNINTPPHTTEGYPWCSGARNCVSHSYFGLLSSDPRDISIISSSRHQGGPGETLGRSSERISFSC